jgi:tRNA A37 threonylcarbamoyladenosine synthetase subunit TsaC/SUA5/YrdC
MTRPDITSDARRVDRVLRGGGVAIIQGDVGYGMLAATPDAARRTVSVKHRAAHKRHGMIGNPEFRREAMKLDQRQHDMIDAITVDFDLPLGVIGTVRKDHPIIAGIEPETLRASMVGDTMAMLHNNGALATELARLSLESNTAFLGSSANLTGTGVKFRVEDIQPEIIESADLVVDYGLAKYHLYRVSSTMINFDSMQVIRTGCCYELISDILKRYFEFECPPDPGTAELHHGYLQEPGARAPL